MKIRREIPRGMITPRFYGLSHVDYSRGVFVCYLIPINLFVSAWYSLIAFLKAPPKFELEKIAAENQHLRQVNTLLRSQRHELQRRMRRLNDEIRELSGDDECPDCFCDPCECEEEW